MFSLRPTSSFLAPRWARSSASKSSSPHARLYSDVFPAMVPVFILGSAVYLGLQFVHMKLTHEKYMVQAEQRLATLRQQVDILERSLKQTASEVPDNPKAKKSSWW